MRLYYFFVLLIFATSSCKKKDIKGCTNGSAVNYNPLAKQDDGSCQYHYYESDSIESVLLAPEIINGPYGFPYYKVRIAAKNSYTISSNYGFEGIYNRLSIFDYSCSENNIISPVSTIYGQVTYCNSVVRTLDQFNHSEGVPVVCVTGLNFDCEELSFDGYTYNGESFIEIGKITSGNVKISEGYEFKLDETSNISANTYDSLIFGFHRGIRLYIKKAISSNNIYTFSADELASLSIGKGHIEVIGMNNYVFYSGAIPNIRINQTIRTKKVNFY